MLNHWRVRLVQDFDRVFKRDMCSNSLHRYDGV